MAGNISLICTMTVRVMMPSDASTRSCMNPLAFGGPFLFFFFQPRREYECVCVYMCVCVSVSVCARERGEGGGGGGGRADLARVNTRVLIAQQSGELNPQLCLRADQ